jgi:hypothetical protein
MAAEYIDDTEIGSGIYPTKIPGYEDAADIQAALRLYHYGSTTIPTENTLGTASGINTKSIAGHFKAIDNTIQTLATTAYVTNAIAGVTDEYAQLAGTGIDWNAGANRFDLDYLSTVIEKTSNFTLEASNVGNTILLSTSSTIALTVPANSVIALPIGYKVDLVEVGSGRTTFTPGSGVTINSKNGEMYIDSQYGKATLLKIAENSWIAYGDIYEGASAPTPTPVAPTPVAPTPVAPTPVAPVPVAPTPVAPTPVAPVPVAPTPVAPTPVAPTPVAPTPVAPTPVAPTPVAPAFAITSTSSTTSSVSYSWANAPAGTVDYSIFYVYDDDTQSSVTTTSSTSATFSGLSSNTTYGVYVSARNSDGTTLASASASITTSAPTPTPVAPTPVAPTPVAPTPVAPTPVAPAFAITSTSSTTSSVSYSWANAPAGTVDYSIFYVYGGDTQSPATTTSSTSATFSGLSSSTTYGVYVSARGSGGTVLASDSASITTSAPTPTPVAPTPVAPTPVAPTPVAPVPVAPTPVAPTPVAPTPVAPTPVAPTPVAPTPVSSNCGPYPSGYAPGECICQGSMWACF